MKNYILLLSALFLAVSTAFGNPLQVQGITADHLKSNIHLRTLPNLDGLQLSAGQGLVKYRALINQNNFHVFGLQSAAEANISSLGLPVRDYMVRLDALKSYSPGSNPAVLLTDTQMVHYPVTIGGRKGASITMGLEGGQWHLQSVGETQRTAKLHAAIASSASFHKQAVDNHFTVRIPALNLEFAATHDAKGVLFLTPLTDAAEWGLKAGVTEPAATVFGRLVPAARAHDGFPH